MCFHIVSTCLFVWFRVGGPGFIDVPERRPGATFGTFKARKNCDFARNKFEFIMNSYGIWVQLKANALFHPPKAH